MQKASDGSFAHNTPTAEDEAEQVGGEDAV
jgi:hypothetical protein